MKKVNRIFWFIALAFVLVLDYVYTHGSSAIALASFFPVFYRSPDPGDGGGGDPPAWAADATFESADKAAEALTSQGFVVRTKDQETKFMETALAQKISDAVGVNQKKFLDTLDEGAKTRGFERPGDSKTTDHIFGVIDNLLNDKKDLNAKLEKKLTEAEAANEIKLQLDTFKKQAKTNYEELEGKYNTLLNDRFMDKVRNNVDGAVNRMRGTFKQNEFLEDAINARKAQFYDKFKPVEHQGTIIYHDKATDEPVLDQKDGHHLTAEEILGQLFEPLVDTQRKAAGTGADGKPATPGAQTKDNEFAIADLPEEIATRVDVGNYIVQKHLHNGERVNEHSTLFNQIWTATVQAWEKKNGKTMPIGK